MNNFLLCRLQCRKHATRCNETVNPLLPYQPERRRIIAHDLAAQIGFGNSRLRAHQVEEHIGRSANRNDAYCLATHLLNAPQRRLLRTDYREGRALVDSRHRQQRQVLRRDRAHELDGRGADHVGLACRELLDSLGRALGADYFRIYADVAPVTAALCVHDFEKVGDEAEAGTKNEGISSLRARDAW